MDIKTGEKKKENFRRSYIRKRAGRPNEKQKITAKKKIIKPYQNLSFSGEKKFCGQKIGSQRRLTSVRYAVMICARILLVALSTAACSVATAHGGTPDIVVERSVPTMKSGRNIRK
jgi:hypothetical protein